MSRASFDRRCEQEVSQGGDHLVVPDCRTVVCPWRPWSTCRHSNCPSGSHNWCPCCLCRLRLRQYHCSRRARRSTRRCSGPGQMHWWCGLVWRGGPRSGVHSQSRGEMEGVGLVSKAEATSLIQHFFQLLTQWRDQTGLIDMVRPLFPLRRDLNFEINQ